MSIDKETVLHIAQLARLSLTEEEVAEYTEDLSVIFDYIEQLNEVNTDGVEETTQVTGLDNIVREDTIELADDEMISDLQSAFPNKKGSYLASKAVFE